MQTETHAKCSQAPRHIVHNSLINCCLRLWWLAVTEEGVWLTPSGSLQCSVNSLTMALSINALFV